MTHDWIRVGNIQAAIFPRRRSTPPSRSPRMRRNTRQDSRPRWRSRGRKKQKKDQERGLSENFNSVSILVFGFETAHSMLLPGLLPIRFARRSIAGAHYRERGGKEAHRRNNANKPITSILRNRRESGRTARWGNGGKGRLPSQLRRKREDGRRGKRKGREGGSERERT